MSQDKHTSREFEAISGEIAEMEAGLRDRFTTLPPLDPSVVSGIKTRLRAEAVRIESVDKAGRSHGWLRAVIATAATLLLATGFYAITRPANTSPQAANGQGSLEIFMASLPQVTGDDAEITQLRQDLRQLESQASSNNTDTGAPGDPAAQRNVADDAHMPA